MTAQTIARDARPEPVMELQGVSMRFGPTLAVKDLSVTFGTGEVVALIGENGAGKTTLGRIASGLVAPTTGQVCYRGEDVTSKLGTEMGLPGVEMVHQELSVVPTISVAENVLIGHEPNRFGFIHRKALRGQARKHLDFVGLDVDPATPCWKLPIAQQQMVEISRAVARDAEMIVFDEPTSSRTRPRSPGSCTSSADSGLRAARLYSSATSSTRSSRSRTGSSSCATASTSGPTRVRA